MGNRFDLRAPDPRECSKIEQKVKDIESQDAKPEGWLASNASLGGVVPALLFIAIMMGLRIGYYWHTSAQDFCSTDSFVIQFIRTIHSIVMSLAFSLIFYGVKPKCIGGGYWTFATAVGGTLMLTMTSISEGRIHAVLCKKITALP